MIKYLGLYSAKPGMSPAAFFQRYEHGHVPLIYQLLGPTMAAYSRSYRDVEEAEAADFDVLTQVWYRDAADYDRAIALMSHPDVAERIAQDEAELFDRPSLLSFGVRESGAAPAGPTAAKVVVLCDGEVALDASAALAVRRNDLIEGSVFLHPLYPDPTAKAPVVVFEAWFATEAEARSWISGLQGVRAAHLVREYAAEGV